MAYGSLRCRLCRRERHAVCRRGVDESGEQEPSVRRSQERVDRMLGMRHEPHYVPRVVDHPGDVAERAVHVLRVAEDDLTTRGELNERTLVRVPGAVAVLHGNHELLSDRAPAHEVRCRALDTEDRVTAHELELPVREENPREQPRLAEDLEPVADPEDGPAGGGEPTDCAH